MSSSGAPAPKPSPGAAPAGKPQPPAAPPPKPPAPPPPPQPPEQWKAIAEKLKDLNPVYEPSKGYLDFVVKPEHLVEAARRLKEMGFDHVISVGVVDYPAKKQFKVMYHVTSYLNEELSKLVVSLSTYINRDDPRVPSLTGVWLSAEFQEREEYEMFGVIFEGHPDLRPLLLTPVVAALKPLRKDFVVKEESDDIEVDYEAFVATKWW
ncbi:MAG: NADH-quinone oxidoreductase subunit C [Acidilobus sp.]